MNLFCSVTIYPQHLLTSFGPCTDVALGYAPSGLTTRFVSASKGREIAVTEAAEPHVHFYSLLKNGVFTETHSHQLSRPVQDVVNADVDGDGTQEYVGLSSDDFSVILLKRRRVWTERRIPLPLPAQRFIVADVDNDKHMEILLYGRKRGGITSLVSRTGGSFVPGPLLFPEIAVSDLKAADLNGDGITDLLLLDWLSDKVTIFYGIGRGAFSEQLALDLPAEPADLAISEVTRRRTFTLAVTIPEEKRILAFTGNAMGELTLIKSIKCPTAPEGVYCGLINDDQYPDIATSTGEGVVVALGTSGTEVGEPTIFGAAHSVAAWTIADIDGDTRKELLLADKGDRRMVALGNAAGTGSSTWPANYCVGNSPRGLATGDFNSDGLMDIAVANFHSSSISVLLNRGKGKISGQYAIPVQDRPSSVTLVSTTSGEGALLIGSHSGDDKISVIRINRNISGAEAFAVPTCTNPFVLSARETSTKGGVQVFVRCVNQGNTAKSLSLVEQLGSGQFLERNVQLTLPYKIIALTVNNFRHEGEYDLLFATHDSKAGKTTISTAFADGQLQFAAPKPVFSFPDSAGNVSAIMTGYLDNDGHKDILLFLGEPRNVLGIGYGRGDGTCRDSLCWVQDVQILNEDATVVGDVNGDNASDLTYIDPRKKSVMIVYGRPDGTLAHPVSVCSAEGISAIRTASLRHQGVQDLILSNEAKGTIQILVAPFAE